MHGGTRNGAGRPKGARNQRTLAMLEAAASGGEMPIPYMLRVMRDENAPDRRRDDMAKAAAAYLHCKLSSIEEEDEGNTEPVQEEESAESAHPPQ